MKRRSGTFILLLLATLLSGSEGRAHDLVSGNDRASGIPSDGPLRLIQTSETTRAWMTPAQVLELSRLAHEDGHCGGFMDVTEHPVQKRLWLRPLTSVSDRALREKRVVQRLMPELSAERMKKIVEKLSSYRTRDNESNSGVEAAHWIRDQFRSMSRGRNDVEVQLVSHAFKQPSVVARIRGQGARASEVVIVGGHEDSINQLAFLGFDRAPGADDNASGVATILETFRVLIESGHRPDRTIEFMTYAGEEKGLLGSQDIAQSYQSAGRQVVGVLQLDMTMHPGPDPEIVLITDNTDKGLNDFLKTLIDEYVQVPWREDECGYACSDHASWDALGYPAAFPFEAMTAEMNKRIHTDGDLLRYLDVSHGHHFAKLALAFAVELSAE